MKALSLILAVGYAGLWLGGVVSYSFMGGPPDGVAWTAPLFLLLAGALIAALTPRAHWRWLAAVAGIGFGSELLGVAFGVPYGGYHYTDVLGPKLLGVPLVLTTAWLVLVTHVQALLPDFKRPIRAAIGATWMTLIDLMLDPLAAGPLGYWVWQDGGAWYGIPWTNFAGWWVVSFAIFAVVPYRWRPSTAARLVGSSVILFFGLIAFALGMLPLAALAPALLLPEVLSWRNTKA
jgi:putative membrane protein